MTTGDSPTPPPVGRGAGTTDLSTLEHLTLKVESLLISLDELATCQFPTLERKLDGLHELLSGRRKEHYVVEEVAAMTGRSEYTVRRWVSQGQLRAIRISEGGPRGRLLIPRAEIERLVAAAKGGKIADQSFG